MFDVLNQELYTFYKKFMVSFLNLYVFYDFVFFCFFINIVVFKKKD